MKPNLKEKADKLMKSKYLPLLFLLGAALMLLPPGTFTSGRDSPAEVPQVQSAAGDVSAEEQRLESVLSKIDGAGQVRVLLAQKSAALRVLAEDEGQTVVISTGSGTQAVVELTNLSPEYLGAVVVCQGADRASVKLAVTAAVSAYTGLGSDKITVIKMKS